jgi:ribonuclease P protein component
MIERPRHTLPKSRHLRSPAEFAAVYDAKVRESRGPLMAYAKPNALGYPRLGMSVSRKVGTAVRRNRIRRLIREAFRLLQHDLPSGYDFVIVVRPHEPAMLADYQRLMSSLFVKLHRTWEGRRQKAEGRSQESPGEGT